MSDEQRGRDNLFLVCLRVDGSEEVVSSSQVLNTTEQWWCETHYVVRLALHCRTAVNSYILHANIISGLLFNKAEKSVCGSKSFFIWKSKFWRGSTPSTTNNFENVHVFLSLWFVVSPGKEETSFFLSPDSVILPQSGLLLIRLLYCLFKVIYSSSHIHNRHSLCSIYFFFSFSFCLYLFV